MEKRFKGAVETSQTGPLSCTAGKPIPSSTMNHLKQEHHGFQKWHFNLLGRQLCFIQKNTLSQRPGIRRTNVMAWDATLSSKHRRRYGEEGCARRHDTGVFPFRFHSVKGGEED